MPCCASWLAGGCTASLVFKDQENASKPVLTRLDTSQARSPSRFQGLGIPAVSATNRLFSYSARSQRSKVRIFFFQQFSRGRTAFSLLSLDQTQPRSNHGVLGHVLCTNYNARRISAQGHCLLTWGSTHVHVTEGLVVDGKGSFSVRPQVKGRSKIPSLTTPAH